MCVGCVWGVAYVATNSINASRVNSFYDQLLAVVLLQIVSDFTHQFR